MRVLTSPVAVSATATSRRCWSRLRRVKYSLSDVSLSHCAGTGRRGSRRMLLRGAQPVGRAAEPLRRDRPARLALDVVARRSRGALPGLIGEPLLLPRYPAV